jgi:hypothetical protein
MRKTWVHGNYECCGIVITVLKHKGLVWARLRFSELTVLETGPHTTQEVAEKAIFEAVNMLRKFED